MEDRSPIPRDVAPRVVMAWGMVVVVVVIERMEAHTLVWKV